MTVRFIYIIGIHIKNNMKAKDVNYPSLIREIKEFGASKALEFETPKEAKKAFNHLKKGLNNKIDWKTPSPQVYDGSTISRIDIEDRYYRIGYDPFRLYKEALNSKVIRLPRKTKKQLKKFWKGKMVKSKLPFYLGVSKVSRYYNCKVKQEVVTLPSTFS